MAKVTIAGQAIVVTSAMKLEDIKTIKKFRPSALTLMGGEDGKEPIFALSAGGCGGGEINKYGASFTGETRDEAKCATLTMTVGYDGDDIKGFVADSIGGALTSLNKLEAALGSVLEEIATEKAVVMSNINIAQ